MAASPQIKIFTPQGEYTAATKHYEEAACLVAFLGDGAEIRSGHTRADCLWREGAEDQPAAESFDHVAETCAARVAARRTARRQRAGMEDVPA